MRLSILLALTSLAASAQAGTPVATFSDFRYEGHQSLTHPARAGAGDYVNPILAGSRSDPSILRVGQDYYLANASMGYWPGQPIWHARDLVHWELIASAITRPDQVDLSGIDPGWQGIWAPDLKYHDGWFYLLNTCYGCGGLFAMRSRDVRGPWPKPTFLKASGIDPSIFFDDGKAYVLFNGPPPQGSADWDGHRAIWLQEIDPATLTLRGERTLLVDGGTHPPEHPFWIEGPHLVRKDGYFYLIAAQGGTNEHHSEVVFRSSALRGPYVAGPKPILSQFGQDAGRADPVANAGHADFVETPKGDWWAVFLAARPYPGGDLNVTTGRDTFLLPVTWHDGWPMIVPEGAPVPLTGRRPDLAEAPVKGWPTAGDYTIVDRFKGPGLSPRWSMMRSSAAQWWSAKGGSLTMVPRPVELGAEQGQPSFLAFRQAHMNAVASITLRLMPEHIGDRAGLALLQDPRSWFFLAVTREAHNRRSLHLFRRGAAADPSEGVSVADVPLPTESQPIRLQIEIKGQTYRFSYRLGNGVWRPISDDQNGMFMSTRMAHGFTGVVVGPATIAGSSN